MSTYLGPTVRVMERLGDEERLVFKNELIELMRGANQSGDDTLFAPAEYLEAVVTLR